MTDKERIIALAAVTQQDVDGLRRLGLGLKGPQTHRLARLLVEMASGTERVLKMVMEKFEMPQDEAQPEANKEGTAV